MESTDATKFDVRRISENRWSIDLPVNDGSGTRGLAVLSEDEKSRLFEVVWEVTQRVGSRCTFNLSFLRDEADPWHVSFVLEDPEPALLCDALETLCCEHGDRGLMRHLGMLEKAEELFGPVPDRCLTELAGERLVAVHLDAVAGHLPSRFINARMHPLRDLALDWLSQNLPTGPHQHTTNGLRVMAAASTLLELAAEIFRGTRSQSNPALFAEESFLGLARNLYRTVSKASSGGPPRAPRRRRRSVRSR